MMNQCGSSMRNSMLTIPTELERCRGISYGDHRWLIILTQLLTILSQPSLGLHSAGVFAISSG